MPKGTSHISIQIHGRVQGVGFRYFAKLKANELGVNGVVKNMADGSVLIEAEAGKDQLAKFIDWCKKGPILAKIDHVTVSPGQLKHHTAFYIA